MITIMAGIHVRSVAGSSEWNLQCICKHCNRSKQASMSDTPRDLFNSGKRILKREAGEAKMIWDLAHEDEDDF